jgi:hypothetical protein
MSTFGPAYDHYKDHDRIHQQMFRVKLAMRDNQWRTLEKISELVGGPEASVSAQLRHLRKLKFGGHTVEKRRVNDSGLWEYRVLFNN